MMSSEGCAVSRSRAAPRLCSLWLTATLQVICLALLMPPAWTETPKAPIEPRAFSVYPLGDRPGSTYEAVVRGVTLREATAFWFENDGIHARIDRTERDSESDPKASTPVDLVNVHVTIDSAVKPGDYPFRVVTKQGVSNAISMR